MKSVDRLLPLIMILALISVGCNVKDEVTPRRTLLLATTTSTDDSGLLGFLLPEFTVDTGWSVEYVAVGTGQALELGKNGDVDVVLVHAKERELDFISQGHGVGRREIMYNDFVVVGPAKDPAGIRSKTEISDVFRVLSKEGLTFISRGDNSGTHIQELQIWELSGTKPGGNWYIEAGQGMGAVLFMAHEMQAYTLTDRGTWLSIRDKVSLELLFQGHPQLRNQYGVIAVNPQKYGHVNYEGAMQFIEWLSGDRGQALINEYGLAQYNQQLFFANYAEGE
jgi:tungstate transport system substrate-binding protein